MNIYINKGICYSCGKLSTCKNPNKAPDYHCDEWEYWQTNKSNSIKEKP